RSHIKFGVLDDTLYLGGVNLTRKITGSLDFMVAIDDPEMVHGFDDFREKYKMADTDLQYDLNAENKFIYDAGRFNSSLIMKTANEMAGRAHSEIKVFCPFYVQDPFKKELRKAADRGCHVEIYTNGVSALHPPYRQFISYTGMGDRLERHRKIDIYRTENEMLHARGILVDGKEALITSHTLCVAEQLLKTQNIALHTRQRNIINPLLDYSYYGIKAACLEIQ